MTIGLGSISDRLEIAHAWTLLIGCDLCSTTKHAPEMPDHP